MLITWCTKNLHTVWKRQDQGRPWRVQRLRVAHVLEVLVGCRVNLWSAFWQKIMLCSLETPCWISTSKIHRGSSLTSNAPREPSTCKKPIRIKAWRTSLWRTEKARRIKITLSWLVLHQSAWIHQYTSKVSRNIRRATRQSKQRTWAKKRGRCSMRMKLWKKISRWIWSMTCSESLRRDSRMLWIVILQVPRCNLGFSKSLTTHLKSSPWVDRAMSMKESAKSRANFSQITVAPWTSKWLQTRTHSTTQETHETRLNLKLTLNQDLALQCSAAESLRGAHLSMGGQSLSLMSTNHIAQQNLCAKIPNSIKDHISLMGLLWMNLRDAWLQTDSKKQIWHINGKAIVQITK